MLRKFPERAEGVDKVLRDRDRSADRRLRPMERASWKHHNAATAARPLTEPWCYGDLDPEPSRYASCCSSVVRASLIEAASTIVPSTVTTPAPRATDSS